MLPVYLFVCLFVCFLEREKEDAPARMLCVRGAEREGETGSKAGFVLTARPLLYTFFFNFLNFLMFNFERERESRGGAES